MSKKHLLVVGVGSRPYNRFYLERLSQHGYEITLITKKYQFWFKDIVDHLIYCDPLDEHACVQAAKEQHHVNPFDGVFVYSEPFVRTASYIASSLHLPGLPVSVANRCRNKYLMRTAFHVAGMRGPKFLLAPNYQQIPDMVHQMEYPVVVKPAEASSSIAVMKLNSDQDLTAYMEQYATIPKDLNFKGEMAQSFLIEEYLPGLEASIDAFVLGDNIIPLMVCEKVLPMEGPLFLEEIFLSPPRYSDDVIHRLKECNERAIRALDIPFGVTHVEFRIVDGEPYVIEAAARPGGLQLPIMIEHLTGLNLPVLMAELATGIAKVPQFHIQSYAAMRKIFAPKTGQVTQLTGLSECMDHPNIREVTVFTKIGEQVYAIPHPNGFRPNIATVIALGRTAEECLESLMEASTQIIVEVNE